MPKGKKKRRRRKREKSVRAPLGRRLELYQKSVQAPEIDVEFFSRLFRQRSGREAVVLREDFCGSALLAGEWVQSDPERRALGVDFHFPTLAWGNGQAMETLGRRRRERLSLVCADVLDVAGPLADVACALNFSFCTFKTRELLGRYFRVVHQGLADDGIFFCELYGGTEAIVEIEESREVDDFTFVWQQSSFNPVNRETLCHIHFDLADGRRIERAFTYDWRLWTIPEVRELLNDAGFLSTRVYWEQVDDEGDGTGEYLPTEKEENQEGWLVYIVAFKR